MSKGCLNKVGQSVLGENRAQVPAKRQAGKKESSYTKRSVTLRRKF